MKEIQIGSLVEECSSWNPAQEAPTAIFEYVDLSAVSQETKSITSSNNILGSDAPSRARQLVRQNDVIVSTVRPNLNSVALVDERYCDATVSTGFCVLRPRKGRLNHSYLFHWVRHPEFIRRMTTLATGASYPAVSDRIIKQSSIPLPSSEDEQERIAAILDKADAIRRKRQQALRLTDDFLRSVFLEMFGDPGSNPHSWEIKRLADLIPDDDVINYGVVQPGEHVPGGIPLVRAGDVDAEVQEPQRLKQISQEIDEQYDRSRLRGGEVLIGCVGAVGSTMIAGPKLAGANIARAVARINLRTDIQAEYILGLLRMPHLQHYFQNEIRVVAQPTLNIKQIKETPVMLPPENLRRQFTAIFRKAKDAHAIARKAEIQSSALFSSLQQRAFSGQL